MPLAPQELSRQDAEQYRGDGGQDGSHSVGVECRAVPSEAVDHDLIKVAGEVAAHGQGAGATPGHRVEVEEAEIQQIEADDPDDHTTQPSPQVDVEGHEVAYGDLLQGARELEMVLEANERELAGGDAQVVDRHAAPEDQQRPSQGVPEETGAVLPACHA